MQGGHWETLLETSATSSQSAMHTQPTAAIGAGSPSSSPSLESNTVSELPTSCASAIELGVDRVKGHHLWAHFKEIEDLSMRRDADAIRQGTRPCWMLGRSPPRIPCPTKADFSREHLPARRGCFDGPRAGGPCPFLGQEAWVSAAGRFDPAVRRMPSVEASVTSAISMNRT